MVLLVLHSFEFNFYMKKYYLIILGAFLLFQSCESLFGEKENPTFHYFFTGHCYQWNAPNWGRSDYRLENIRLDTFDQIWLGGDLVENMFHHPDNLNFVDTFFRVGAPTTHWAVGNHDVLDQAADFSKIEKRTGRKTFNTSHSQGITMLVLNTTEFGSPNYYSKPHECATLDGQLQLLKSVTDTIQESSHLVILHHHALLTNELTDNQVNIQKVFNFYAPNYNLGCEKRGTFTELIYPQLVEVQKRGVQVILLGGDTGQQVKEFEFTTKEGITFLGSGLNNSAGTKGLPAYFNPAPDKILIFTHQPKKRKLDWKFEVLTVNR